MVLTIPNRRSRVPFIAGTSVATAFLLLAIYIAFFWRLGLDPLRKWDEGAVAVNSLEMLHNGQLFAKYMGSELDFTDTKPPLANWLIVLAMSVFGPGEFAIRFPSAVAATITVVFIAVFCLRFLQDRIAAIAAPAVLLTSVGFTGEHVARGGDYDALLSLFVTIYVLSGFAFGYREQRRFVVAGAAAFSLSIMTKGVAGLLMAPGLFLWLVAQRNIRRALTRFDVLASMTAALALPLTVYAVTELYQPGYIHAVAKNELWGRFGHLVQGGTPSGPFYYVKNFVLYRFIPWSYFMPLCLIVRHPFIKFGAVMIASFLLIISASQSKYPWYDAPFYPVASICIGLSISRFIILFRIEQPSYWKAGLLLGSFFLLPAYANLYREVVREHIPYRDNDMKEGIIARDYASALNAIVERGILEPGSRITIVNGLRYNTPLLFVARRAEFNDNRLLDLDWQEPSGHSTYAGRYLLNCFPELEGRIASKTRVRKLLSQQDCTLFEVLG
jgi:4-amino-4-deoxy-L-arabinose transferase-like glycosyltransferase